MMDDPVLEATQKFIAAVENRIAKQDEMIRGQSEEIRSLREEIQTRAASTALVKPLEEVIREEMARVEFNATPGRDGRGITAAAIRDGKLFLRMTDDTEQEVGTVVGPPGKDAEGLPGKDGHDGKDGERGADSIIPGPKGDDGADGIATREELDSIIEARMADIQVRSFADAYEGVWKDGLHKRGVFTTWGGSLWLSLADTENKPGENGDWRLVVKKGSDAKR